MKLRANVGANNYWLRRNWRHRYRGGWFWLRRSCAFALRDMKASERHTSGMCQCVDRPGVGALASALCRLIDGGADALRHTQRHFCVSWRFRFFTTARAAFKVKINACGKLFFKLRHIVGVECNRAANACDFTPKNIIIGVKMDAGCVALVLHCVRHFLNPCLSRKSRTLSSWYCFNSLPGCGRWSAIWSPSSAMKRTREPSALPSYIWRRGACCVSCSHHTRAHVICWRYDGI